MNANTKKLAALVGLFLLSLPACAIQAKLPDKFLELDSDRYQLKATSADDAILWVRRFDNQADDGTLEFWTEALKNNLVDARGYTLVGREKIRTDKGLEGEALVLEATVAGQTQRELCALFLTHGLFGDARVYVVEYVAPKDLFERYAKQVKQTIESLSF